MENKFITYYGYWKLCICLLCAEFITNYVTSVHRCWKAKFKYMYHLNHSMVNTKQWMIFDNAKRYKKKMKLCINLLLYFPYHLILSNWWQQMYQSKATSFAQSCNIIGFAYYINIYLHFKNYNIIIWKQLKSIPSLLRISTTVTPTPTFQPPSPRPPSHIRK